MYQWIICLAFLVIFSFGNPAFSKTSVVGSETPEADKIFEFDISSDEQPEYRLKGFQSASPNDKQVPRYFYLGVRKIEPKRYQIKWSTDLVTKGKVICIDSNGKVLSLAKEKGQYCYDHKINFNVPKIGKDFSLKIEAIYLNGSKCVTLFNPDSLSSNK